MRMRVLCSIAAVRLQSARAGPDFQKKVRVAEDLRADTAEIKRTAPESKK